MLLEACAGLLDNEDPEMCVIRESEEETGYKLKKVHKIFEAYMSPGGLTELLHFFIAEYRDSMRVSKGGGLKEEQEHIEVLKINYHDAMSMVKNGEIKDAKTILLLQYLSLNNLL